MKTLTHCFKNFQGARTVTICVREISALTAFNRIGFTSEYRYENSNLCYKYGKSIITHEWPIRRKTIAVVGVLSACVQSIIFYNEYDIFYNEYDGKILMSGARHFFPRLFCLFMKIQFRIHRIDNLDS